MKSKLTGIVLATIMLASVFMAIVPVGSPETSFNADLSSNSVNPSDEFFIFGTALGVEGVNILIVSPKGPYGDRIDGSGTGVYHRIAAVSDNTFSKNIIVGLGIETGSYLVLVLSPGRDGVYGGLAGGVGVSNFVEELEDQYGPLGFTQDQFLALIEDATISAPGSDDDMWTDYIDVGRGGVACVYAEEGVMVTEREFECDCTYHWTGGAAASLAYYIDKNYYSKDIAPYKPDGRCYEEEIDEYISHELKRQQKDELEGNMLIDGTRGEIIGSDCKYGYPGYEAIKEDLKIKCTYWIKFRDFEYSNEHVYSRVGLKEGDFVSFTVPTGWIISSTEDLKGSSISADKRTVTGVATDKAYVIKFSKAGIPSPSITITPVPSPTPIASPTPTYTPLSTITPTSSPIATPTSVPTAPEETGFEMLLAIAGLLAVAYLLRRRK